MARRPRPFMPRRQRRFQAMRWRMNETDKISIADVMCKCVHNDKDGYIFQSIAHPAVLFAFTPEEWAAIELEAVVCRPAEGD